MGICNPLEIVTVHEILKVKVVVSFSDNMTKMLELKTWNSNPDFSIRFSLEGLTNGHGFLKNDKYDSPDNDKTLFKINLHYNTDKTYYFLKIILYWKQRDLDKIVIHVFVIKIFNVLCR